MTTKQDYSKYIPLIKEHGGHLYFGRCSWSLHIYEHKAWPNDTASTSTKTITLSGYYNIHDSHELFDLCLENNIPILDTRNTSLDQACKTISMPLINTAKDLSSGYVTIQQYKNEAMTRGHDFIKFYNI